MKRAFERCNGRTTKLNLPAKQKSVAMSRPAPEQEGSTPPPPPEQEERSSLLRNIRAHFTQSRQFRSGFKLGGEVKPRAWRVPRVLCQPNSR